MKPESQPASLIACPTCGEGELRSVNSDWLKCTACSFFGTQTDADRIKAIPDERRLQRQIDECRIEDQRRRNRKGSRSKSYRKDDGLKGTSLRSSRSDDVVSISQLTAMAPKSEFIHVRGVPQELLRAAIDALVCDEVSLLAWFTRN